MTYIVDKDSPPRYFVQGAESDDSGEEIDYKEMRSLKTRKLAEDIFKNPQKYTFECEIKFKNFFADPAKNVRVQTVRASNVSLNERVDSLVCVFEPDNDVYFSYNHNARYSKITLFVTTNGQRKMLSIFQQYIEKSDPVSEYQISSLDSQLNATVAPLSGEALRELKPKAARQLLFTDSPSTVTVHSNQNQLKVGGTLLLKKISITTPLTT